MTRSCLHICNHKGIKLVRHCMSKHRTLAKNTRPKDWIHDFPSKRCFHRSDLLLFLPPMKSCHHQSPKKSWTFDKYLFSEFGNCMSHTKLIKLKIYFHQINKSYLLQISLCRRHFWPRLKIFDYIKKIFLRSCWSKDLFECVWLSVKLETFYCISVSSNKDCACSNIRYQEHLPRSKIILSQTTEY